MGRELCLNEVVRKSPSAPANRHALWSFLFPVKEVVWEPVALSDPLLSSALLSPLAEAPPWCHVVFMADTLVPPHRAGFLARDLVPTAAGGWPWEPGLGAQWWGGRRGSYFLGQQVFLCEVPASQGVVGKWRLGNLSGGDDKLFTDRKAEGRG